MQLLSKAIHGILTDDTDITDTVGSGNIWHSKVPQRTTTGTDTPPPLSIYFYTYAVNPTGSTKTGRAEIDEHMIRVCIVGSDDENMYEVARYVRYALDRITPGTYNDIPIQGIEFLNASFDPEGSYELENQSWVLEFKVRVIDNDIRVPGSNPAVFTDPANWYSASEQVWPYNKHTDGRTIYWKTFTWGATSGLKDLTGFTPNSFEELVQQSRLTSYHTFFSQWWLSDELIVPQADNDDPYQITLPNGMSQHKVTIWYTKT